MAPRVLVWRDDSVRAELKELFFSVDPSSYAERQTRALQIVAALQTRGSVPHAVEATALLVAAQLQDQDGSSVTVTSRQMGHSMALIRFVNGLLDQYQQAERVIPLFTLAKRLELPLFLVELRHQATHEHLPSLPRLRNGTEIALKWLLDKYWEEGGNDLTPMQDVTEATRSLLRQWRSQRRHDPSLPVHDHHDIVVRLARARASSKSEFCTALTGVLLRSAGLTVLYGPLVTALNRQCQPQCVGDELAAQMYEILDSHWPQAAPASDQVDSATAWISYLITNSLTTTFASTLAAQPRPWNVALLRLYGEERLDRIADAMAIGVGMPLADPAAKRRRVELHDDEGEVDNQSPGRAHCSAIDLDKASVPENDSDLALIPASWEPIPNWTPRPFGQR